MVSLRRSGEWGIAYYVFSIYKGQGSFIASSCGGHVSFDGVFVLDRIFLGLLSDHSFLLVGGFADMAGGAVSFPKKLFYRVGT